ncbi:MAG: VOC family protein [Clostridiales bacterium]
MKYLWTTIQVKNLDESIAFYHDIVELPLNKRFSVGEDVEIAFMGDGETNIELLYNKKTAKDYHREGISLGFKVTSLTETMEVLKAKDLKISDVFSPNPHTSFFFVKDPNGVNIQFVEEK